MIHTLQDYIQRLKGLQDGKRAPYKSFFLLIIMGMLESGELSENRISFREIEEKKPFFAELIAVFNSGNAKRWQPTHELLKVGNTLRRLDRLLIRHNLVLEGDPNFRWQYNFYIT